MQIDKDKLTKGMHVWYRYAKKGVATGPHLVIGIGRGHTGMNVVLDGGMRNFTLELDDEDEDYGELQFFTQAPAGTFNE